MRLWANAAMMVLFLPSMAGAQELRRQEEEVGTASLYASAMEGRATASGEIFHQNIPSAAHRDLPLGTMVVVTNLANGQVTVVTVNDRLSSASPHVLDLSAGAASQIGMSGMSGVAPVRVEPVARVE